MKTKQCHHNSLLKPLFLIIFPYLLDYKVKIADACEQEFLLAGIHHCGLNHNSSIFDSKHSRHSLPSGPSSERWKHS